MKKSRQKRDEVLQVLKCTKPNGEEISLLATDKRILCYQPKANRPWEPTESEYLGLVSAIRRL